MITKGQPIVKLDSQKFLTSTIFYFLFFYLFPFLSFHINYRVNGTYRDYFEDLSKYDIKSSVLAETAYGIVSSAVLLKISRYPYENACGGVSF